MPGSAKGRKRQAPTSGDTEEELLEVEDPDTAFGQFIQTITTAIESFTPVTPIAAEVGSVRATLLKRRIASCPTLTETDTNDHVKLMAWLRAADRIAPAVNGDHTMALDVLSLTASLDSEDPISTILENARTANPCNESTWTTTRGLILSTIPDIVQIVETSISATDPRAPGEDLSKYYLRYQKSLSHARLVRSFMSKDVGNDEWLMATLALPKTATFNDFYNKVCQAARVFPETTNDQHVIHPQPIE